MKRIACVGSIVSGIALLLMLSLRGQAQQQPAGPTSGPVPAESRWDFGIDTHLDGNFGGNTYYNHCDLKVTDNHIVGKYYPEDERSSRLTGEFIQGAKSMVVLRDEDDTKYTCIFVGTNMGNNRFVGTWYDTKGNAGEFELKPRGGN